MCNDLATVAINRQVQLSPVSSGLYTVLFFQPLASAIDLQSGAVGRCLWPMVSRFWPVGSAWCDRAQADPIPSYHIISSTELRSPSLWRKRSPNTMPSIRVERLATTRLAPWGCPARQRFRWYAKYQAATAAKARLILRPVCHFELHPADVMAAGGWRLAALCLCGIWINQAIFDLGRIDAKR